jgi:hypothetical protein
MLKSDHLAVKTRVSNPHHFNADPDPAFHQSDVNLRSMVYRPYRSPFEPPRLHCERTHNFADPGSESIFQK